MAISSLYGGAGIPVDNKIEPLAPCLIWMDRRAKEETDWVKTNLDLDNLYQDNRQYSRFILRLYQDALDKE